MLAAQYQRAFFDLLGHVENVSVLLAKGQVAGSPGQTALLLTDAWSQALSAQAHLNALPFAPGVHRRTSTFLTQAGDFAHMMAAEVARGRQPSPEMMASLAELQSHADRLARELHAIADGANRGQMRWHEVQRLASSRLDDTPTHPLGEGVARIEEDLLEYPTLLYDGPFSDHVTRREPRTVPENEVTDEEARDIAARFLALTVGNERNEGDDRNEGDERNNEPNNDRNNERNLERLRLVEQVNGRIPAYRFEWAHDWDATAIRLDVARRGGDVVWMVDPRMPGQTARISGEEAIRRAQQLADQLGLSPVEPVFPLRVPGRMLVPLAPVRDGIVHYPDQVKVVVSLEDGRILGYFAVDRIMNRGPRTEPEPILSEEEARARLNPRLTVTEPGRLAWILDHALRERFAYEFAARLEGDEYRVYLDAVTGDEIRIEKVLPTDEGPVVM